MVKETAHKARAAGTAGSVASAAAVLIGHYTDMPMEPQLALAVVIGWLGPFAWAYWQRNYPK